MDWYCWKAINLVLNWPYYFVCHLNFTKLISLIYDVPSYKVIIYQLVVLCVDRFSKFSTYMCESCVIGHWHFRIGRNRLLLSCYPVDMLCNINVPGYTAIFCHLIPLASSNKMMISYWSFHDDHCYFFEYVPCTWMEHVGVVSYLWPFQWMEKLDKNY